MSDDENDKWKLEPFRFDDSPAAEEPEPEPEPVPAPRRARPVKEKKVKPPKEPKAPKPPKEKKPRRERIVSDGQGWERFKTLMGRLKWLWITLAVLFVIGTTVAIGGGVYIWRKYLTDVPPLPDRAALFAVNRAPGIKFLDREGALIATRGPRYGSASRWTSCPIT